MAPGRARPVFSLSAASTVVGVVGDPIAHSLSPALHNAAFAALGLDWVSLGFRVPEGSIAGALAGVRSLGIRGLSVTMPHKSSAAAQVDERTPLSERLGAVNCVSNRSGVLVGDSTDGPGLVAALRRQAAFDPRGARCLVIGAGGAARGVVAALADAGASEVVVVNRTRRSAQEAAALAGPVGRVGGGPDAAACDLVVNATPSGMPGTAVGTLPEASDTGWTVDPGLLLPGQVVVDLVYHPPNTPWLEAARDRGALGFNGLGMLVHQAALQIGWWTGLEPPIDAMWRSVAATSPG